MKNKLALPDTLTEMNWIEFFFDTLFLVLRTRARWKHLANFCERSFYSSAFLQLSCLCVFLLSRSHMRKHICSIYSSDEKLWLIFLSRKNDKEGFHHQLWMDVYINFFLLVRVCCYFRGEARKKLPAFCMKWLKWYKVYFVNTVSDEENFQSVNTQMC